jgi:hypothetical protein
MITGFNIDIYGCCVAFAWDTNQKEIDAFLEQCAPTDACLEGIKTYLNEPCAAALTITVDTINIATFFKDEPTNNMVAHELYHVACRVLQPRGIEDEEAWAYLIGYLTEMFYDLYLGKAENVEDISPKAETEDK